jgi:hypothetical protein
MAPWVDPKQKLFPKKGSGNHLNNFVNFCLKNEFAIALVVLELSIT